MNISWFVRQILHHATVPAALLAATATTALADNTAALRDAVANAQLEAVATGTQFSEGPVWVPETGLLYSDIPADRIILWTEDAGARVWREPSGNSNGLILDREGRLIACEHGNRRVSRTETDGSLTTLASHFEGRRLNSPNDAIVAADGGIYFTDPPYGVREEDRELDFQGVYRIPPGGGAIQLLIDDFDRPNGIGLSPDGRTLYIQDSARAHCRAFDVLPDGSLANGRVYAEMTGTGNGVPDGMAVDQEGNTYLTAVGGVWVFTATGEHLGTIPVPKVAANCAFGDADRRSLFITAVDTVFRVRLPIPGLGAHQPGFRLY